MPRRKLRRQDGETTAHEDQESGCGNVPLRMISAVGALLVVANVIQTTPRLQRWKPSDQWTPRAVTKALQTQLDFLKDQPPAWERVLGPVPDGVDEMEQKDAVGIYRGILSNKPESFFRKIQQEIDNQDLEERCARYGFFMRHPSPDKNISLQPNRRIFWGSMISDETWELLDIVTTEVYGIYSGVVLVEGNRTHNFAPKPFKRDDSHVEKMKLLYGTQQVQIRQYINENPKILDMNRDLAQRQEILIGWKEMGMKPDDVAVLGDLDESFSRDFLRAVKHCPYIPALDYENHHCDNSKANMIGNTRVFETSPNCLTKSRSWYHPDMVMGACVEEIGSETLNYRAPRSGAFRMPGHAHCGADNKKFIEGNRFPLYSGSDFRMLCGGKYQNVNAPNHTVHSAFHFHNFFTDFNTTRHKYLTYAHPVKEAMSLALEDLHSEDLRMMVRCVLNLTDAPKNEKQEDKQGYVREPGGIEGTLPLHPIYFMDKDYRDRKHMAIQIQIEKDEQLRRERVGMSPLDRQIEDANQAMKEARRVFWAREAEVKALEKQKKK